MCRFESGRLQSWKLPGELQIATGCEVRLIANKSRPKKPSKTETSFNYRMFGIFSPTSQVCVQSGSTLWILKQGEWRTWHILLLKMLKFFLVKEVPKINSLKETTCSLIDASLMAARHWCVRSISANLENTRGHHLEAGRPKPSLESSIFRPWWCKNQGAIGAEACLTFPWFFLAPQQHLEPRWNKKTASLSLRNLSRWNAKGILPEYAAWICFFCFKTISYKFSAKTIWPPRIRSH